MGTLSPISSQLIGDKPNSPVTLAERVQSQLVSDLSCVHGVGQVLLVGKYQQHSIAQLILSVACVRGASVERSDQEQPVQQPGTASSGGARERKAPTHRRIAAAADPDHVETAISDPTAPHLVEHAVQLVPGLANTVAIVAVDHEDQPLRVLEVVPPQRTDLYELRRGFWGRQGVRRVHSSRLVLLRGCCCSTSQAAAPSCLTLSWPPTSQTVKLMFLYSTVSTLKPARGGEGKS